MNKYRDFSVDDFLQDEFFNQWVKNASKEDCEIWEDWLLNNPEKIKVIDKAKQLILAFKNEPKKLPDDFYEKLKLRIDNSVHQEINEERKFFTLSGLLKMVAVIACLISGAYILFHSEKNEKFITYRSKYAETKRIILPDGSEVVLNANSELKYKDVAGTESREAWLTGEGFFHVKHKEDNTRNAVRFVVHAKNINVEVLGTAFNVNNTEGGEAGVLLKDGKIKLSVVEEKETEPVIMHPGEFALFNTKTKRITLNKVSPASYTAWMQHKYILEKTRLEDLIKQLQHYYGKTITVPDVKMRDQRLSGILELQDEESLIQTLSALLGVPVQLVGDQIKIGSK